MELNLSLNALVTSVDVEATASFILKVQKDNGEIPWSVGGKTDPWDHVESAMGLSMAGYIHEAERGYDWLIRTQMKDGTWYSAYRDGEPEDMTKDTNMSSYIAVGAFHHYLITGDRTFLRQIWPSIKAGINYAVSLQAPSGEIFWAKNGLGVLDPMALLTGSSSIYMSLKCSLAIAGILGKKMTRWEVAMEKLGEAIRNRPSLFNMMKARYSMDWYYPILCGAVTGAAARMRIDKYWEKFVVSDWGVRCVCDRPWVTMAETSELVLALKALGEDEKARVVFNWMLNKKYDDGSYWMGVTFPDTVIWPEEKTAWTAAAVLLAFDALHELTPASRLFHHESWAKSVLPEKSVESEIISQKISKVAWNNKPADSVPALENARG